MASHDIQFLCYALLFLSLTLISTAISHRRGFTVDLIHRDSPAVAHLFPNSSGSSDWFPNAIRRSAARARHIEAVLSKASPNVAGVPVYPIVSEYVIDISIGTPPTRVLLNIDTGSDMVWTQCQSCINCYEQSIPIFDPKNSSTYKNIPCGSAECKALNQNLCSGNICTYGTAYGDGGTYSKGDFSSDTLTINSATSIPNFWFGCGHEQRQMQKGESGIIGLGQAPVSLAGQTLENPAFAGKFAYCLVYNGPGGDPAAVSRISFGEDAVVSGDGVVSTPFPGDSDLYSLTLNGNSVGGTRISYNKGSSNAKGNIIIDSGSSLTNLPKDLYWNFVSALKSAIKATPVGQGDQLCYEANVEIPNATFHFEGADVELKPINIFAPLPNTSQKCISMVPNDNIAIFSSLAQADFLVGYDLVAKKVSFKPTDCAKYMGTIQDSNYV